jgi:hypothetical protein
MSNDRHDRVQSLTDLRYLLEIVDRKLANLRGEGRPDAIRQLEEIRSLTIQTMDSLSARREDPVPVDPL